MAPRGSKPFTVLLPFLLYNTLCFSVSAETYIYVEKDGTRWITDHPIIADGFTYVAKYGRPTASLSCKGVTTDIMERRAHHYMPDIFKLAEQQNVNPYLVKALIAVESCFDTRAVSRVGAKGLMQLMPETARQYDVYDRFHAQDNLRAGITHLSELLILFNDNIEFSLAAYNAGSTAVKKYRNIPPYTETRQYVKKVMHHYHQYLSQNAGLEQSP